LDIQAECSAGVKRKPRPESGKLGRGFCCAAAGGDTKENPRRGAAPAPGAQDSLGRCWGRGSCLAQTEAIKKRLVQEALSLRLRAAAQLYCAQSLHKAMQRTYGARSIAGHCCNTCFRCRIVRGRCLTRLLAGVA
jgi:hypothetical protein